MSIRGVTVDRSRAFNADYRLFLNDFIPTLAEDESWDHVLAQCADDSARTLGQTTGRQWSAEIISKTMTDFGGRWCWDYSVRFTPLPDL